MFLGYNPLGYKLSIWVISAVMCGVAGALYVPQVGIINPGEMSPVARGIGYGIGSGDSLASRCSRQCVGRRVVAALGSRKDW